LLPELREELGYTGRAKIEPADVIFWSPIGYFFC
jgi:hypothetical protein